MNCTPVISDTKQVRCSQNHTSKKPLHQNRIPVDIFHRLSQLGNESASEVRSCLLCVSIKKGSPNSIVSSKSNSPKILPRTCAPQQTIKSDGETQFRLPNPLLIPWTDGYHVFPYFWDLEAKKFISSSHCVMVASPCFDLISNPAYHQSTRDLLEVPFCFHVYLPVFFSLRAMLPCAEITRT